MRTTPALLVSLLCSVPVLSEATALACGGLVQDVADGAVGQDAQRAFLAVHDGRTEVVLQVAVPAAGSPYGVLVPTPVQPQIDPEPVASKELDTLEANTRPKIVLSSSGGGGGGCAAKAEDLGGEGVPGGVIVGSQVEVGPVTAVSLSATDGAALSAWLTQSGFVLPANAQRIIDGYAGPGRWSWPSSAATRPAGSPAAWGST